MKTKKLTIKIEGMHCASCAMHIDLDLEELEGVKNATTNYAKAICTIEVEEKVTPEEVIEHIKKTGYKARMVVK